MIEKSQWYELSVRISPGADIETADGLTEALAAAIGKVFGSGTIIGGSRLIAAEQESV